MAKYTEKDLVDFGKYLLSDKRSELIFSNETFTKEERANNSKEVHHADYCNWLESRKKIKN